MLTVRPHHLLCAVCHAAGCKNVPAGDDRIEEIIKATKADPAAPIKLIFDIEVPEAHWRDIFEGELGSDPDFARRQADYVGRFRDLEVCRQLNVRPNGVYPAFELAKWLAMNITTLEGICFYKEGSQDKWPECPHARLDSPKKMRGQMGLGQEVEGLGAYIFLPLRTPEELQRVKEETAQEVMRADRLFVRPHHLMCMLCSYGHGGTKRREDDHLYELLLRMQADPELPITLVEGACQMCDPCPAYHPESHTCFHSYLRDQYKDLRAFQKLGLAPGDTVPAGKLMSLLYDRVTCVEEVCTGFQSEGKAYLWSSCSGTGYAAAREKRMLAR